MRIFYQSPVAQNWIRQRPHFMAEGLASCGHQVFWFYAAAFTKCRLRRFDNGHGLTGIELPVLPFASRFRLFEWLNRMWVSWWLRHVRADVVIATNPVALPWLPSRLAKTPHVYDCMDVQTAFFTGRRRRRMVETERALVHDARAIVASSDVIRSKLVDDYSLKNTVLTVVPNGIQLSESESVTAPVQVSHPSIAYFGTIAPWFDWDGVKDAATRHPEWRFDLFGPCDGKTPALPANVVLRGGIPHEAVMAQARAADVLVMPFVRNELIDGVDPVKMYEYLRTGRPIVSSWWPLLEKFRQFGAVRFYGQGASLSDCLAAALAGPRSFPVPESFLAENSWAERVNSLEAVIVQNVPNRKDEAV